MTWPIPPQTPHRHIVSPDLTPLLERLRLVHGWSEMSAITFILTPVNVAGKQSGTRTFKVHDVRTQAMAEFSGVAITALLFVCLGPLLLRHLQKRPLFTQLLDQDPEGVVRLTDGCAREMLQGAPNTDLHEKDQRKGQAKSWGWRRVLLVVLLCGIAVLNGCERAVRFGREAWFEAREGQAFAAGVDGLLFVCAVSIFHRVFTVCLTTDS